MRRESGQIAPIDAAGPTTGESDLRHAWQGRKRGPPGRPGGRDGVVERETRADQAGTAATKIVPRPAAVSGPVSAGA
ncbi:hypothetical protein Aca07nite_30720 [Actinoplanes capillaceus]|uniref:Uncharacterized protein n=1 Tax=Actinoplanes campanulatus TaxID=113559 RepID=A0ABQ3WHV3_9ACTN|nr:hypothetical protein Aca07nite_30720 [Actinoplanes capillaceus]